MVVLLVEDDGEELGTDDEGLDDDGLGTEDEELGDEEDGLDGEVVSDIAVARMTLNP